MMLLTSPTMNVASTVVVEGGALLSRMIERKAMFGRARERARATAKPLVIVGAPSRFLSPQYKCGDLRCIDPLGCALCASPPVDITQPGAIPVADGGAVVLVQHVLEYVDDIDGAWTEIQRAAGKSSDVFVSRMQDWASLTRLMSGVKYIVTAAPPFAKDLTYKRVRRAPKKLAKGGRA